MARIPHKLSVYVRRFVNDTLLAEFPTATTAETPGFDTWTEADADRPVLLTVEATAQTDGATDGEVAIDVDEDGGTAADYTLTVALADLNAGAAVDASSTATIAVPPGAQYQIQNVSDPNAANSIDAVQQSTL